MAAILPKYGQNSENDENSHTKGHFSPCYAPGCLRNQKQEVLKIYVSGILPKYGQNSENDENSHTKAHFKPYYAPRCLGIQKQEVLKIYNGSHIAQIWSKLRK